HRAHSPAHGERDEDLLGGAAHHVDHGLPPGRRRGDVEEGQLIGALGVVPPGELHRVTGVPEVLEVDALDHPPGVHVEARDDPYGDRHCLHSPRYASTSTSTSIRESISPATWTLVHAGRTEPKKSPCARPTLSKSSGFTT